MDQGREREESASSALLMMKMKIAAAVACISKKPADLSGEEYARKLCSQYQLSQIKWKETCQRAQAQILQLKQELVLSSLENGSENTSSLENVFLTPPPSGAYPVTAHSSTNTDPEESLADHTKFMQSLLSLKRITCNEKEVTETLMDTVFCSLACIGDWISRDVRVSGGVARECLQIIHRVVGMRSLSRSPFIVDAAEDVGVSIIDKLLDDRGTWQRKAKVELLSACTSLPRFFIRDKVMDCMLDRVEFCTKHLQDVAKGQENLNVDLHENMAFLFSLIEISLHQYNSIMCDSHSLDHVQRRLDRALLHVTETFPLYAHAIWKLQGMIDDIMTTLFVELSNDDKA